MNLSQAQALFSHLIALLGFFSIWITGAIDNLSAIVFLTALVFSFVNSKTRRQYYINENLSTFLAIALIVYVFLSFFVLGVEVFNAILMFLIFTQVIKLLGKKAVRDNVQIYILSFFQLLSGSVVAINFGYGVAFVLYVAVSLSAIVVLNITKEAHDKSNQDDPSLVTGKFLSTTTLIGVFVLLFTALIFVSVPRIRTGFLLGDFIRPNSLRTGFSDEVRLGQVGQIKFDNSPVMRAVILNRGIENVRRPIYWRGIALDEFDGIRWRASKQNYKTIKKNRYGRTVLKHSENEPLAQEILTEPIDTDILFSANVPVGFENLQGSMITEINDSYILPNNGSYKLRYVAYSDVGRPSATKLRSDPGEYPADIRDNYLQLPSVSKDIQDLSERLGKGKTNAYDMAVSIRNYLQASLVYTRTLARGTAEFPLDEFLFQNKAGHCEYFATSMVVMLRVLGVPSRLVNGFIDGEWNPHGKFFLVRERDAHSWVEVYFPSYGWVSFDPTPAGTGLDAEKGAFYFFSSYIDYLKFRWSRYVVDYNKNDQNRFFRQLRKNWVWQVKKIKAKSFSEYLFDKRWLVVSVMFGFTLWVLLKQPLLRRLPGLRKNYARTRASVLYKNAVSIVSRKGLKKDDYMAPREFAKSLVAGDKSIADNFAALTEAYLELRFGKRHADENIKTLERLLGILKKRIK